MERNREKKREKADEKRERGVKKREKNRILWKMTKFKQKRKIGQEGMIKKDVKKKKRERK